MAEQEFFEIRQRLDQVDVDELYGIYETMFSVKIHHGGHFTELPGRVYVDGHENFVDLFDPNKFSVRDLDLVLFKLGYVMDINITLRNTVYYHYLIPGSDLDLGLQPIGSSYDALNFLEHVGMHKTINVYIEHGFSTVNTYFCSPRSLMLNLNDRRNEVGTEQEEHTLLDYGDDELFGASQLNDNYVQHSEDTHGSNDVEEGDNGTKNVDGNADGTKKGDGKHATNDVDDDNDSDFVVEEGDEIADVKVDMMDYLMNVDADVEDFILDKKEDDELIKYDVIDNEDFYSGDESDDDATRVRKRMLRQQRMLNEKKSIFYVGQIFGNKKEIKDLITNLAVNHRREIKIKKDDNTRVRAYCYGELPNFEVDEDGVYTQKKEQVNSSKSDETKGLGPASKHVGGRGKIKDPDAHLCPWVLYASKITNTETWMIKTLVDEHTCLQTRTVSKCTAAFLANHLVDQLQENPKIPVVAVQEQLQRKFELGVSKMKAFRAKTKAMMKIYGDYDVQYGLLRDYCTELMKANPGSTVKLEMEPATDPTSSTRRFMRIYVCLGPLKQGFKAIGRDLLGLDGTFMKGPYPGQILSAVGIDGNNGIYPLSYAIVEAETTETWTWFLECLGDDLDLVANSNFTFVSDRQKGILPAIGNLFPYAEHRYCLRHINENMKQTFKGKAYKDMLWKLGTTTTKIHFQKAMNELKNFNKDAHDWLSKIPPNHWSRSHFSGRARSDVLLNNMCEVFNGKIVEGRDKPIITVLEYIREYLMRRIVTVLKVIENSSKILTPTAYNLFEAIKKEAAKCIVGWNGGDQYQVKEAFGEQYVVDMRLKVCACRRWEITGMPCKHSVASLWFMASNGQKVGIPESWVDKVYHLSTWKKVYNFKLFPINGMSMWPSSSIPTTIIAPRYHKPIGRPKKARKRSATEMEGITNGGRLSKKDTTMTCGICKKIGHNKRTCKGQGESGQVQLGHVHSGQVQLGQVYVGQVQPGQVQSGQVQHIVSVFGLLSDVLVMLMLLFDMSNNYPRNQISYNLPPNLQTFYIIQQFWTDYSVIKECLSGRAHEQI
ncbi:hypothetical protein QVD17_32873 [Tagetes erecta]|uniref:SWIM-type domain-containing protein n=1 Tax=Tagetes erecta TaxID=13708 RepID=A0AAD8NKT5_TARER|nr:hypothetical protein QVD17_32873 [Tagetes erecta]